MPDLVQERAKQTRRNIINAAAETIHTLGYHGCSVNDIMREAGITKGALYFHFNSKAEVARAVTATAQETVELTVESTVAAHGWGWNPVAEALAALYDNDPTVRGAVQLAIEPNTPGCQLAIALKGVVWKAMPANTPDEVRGHIETVTAGLLVAPPAATMVESVRVVIAAQEKAVPA